MCLVDIDCNFFQVFQLALVLQVPFVPGRIGLPEALSSCVGAEGLGAQRLLAEAG